MVTFGLFAGITHCLSDEFRIETQVYSGRDERPVSENLTLFARKIVYDFLFEPGDTSKTAEIVIYDLDKDKFVVMDVARQVKLELTATDLMQLVETLKTSEPWRDKYPFLLNPKFETRYDEPSQRMELTSKHISYSVKAEPPPNASVFPAYAEFVDACAQLNATDPRKLPPFARLELNRELKLRKIIPTEVEMKMDFPAQGLNSIQISAISKHSIIWQISKMDQERIQTANRYWVKFRTVTIGEYRRNSGEPIANR